MNKNENNGGWWFVFIVLLALCLIIAGVKHHKGVMAMQAMDLGASSSAMTGDQTASGAAMSTEDVSTGDVNAANPGAAPLAYDQALVTYANARIQFDENCAATPTKATFTNGSLVMLDNRSDMSRDIHLGSLGDVTIKAWGFKIVSLTSSLLPNDMAVDCGSQQNVAIISIQK